VIEFTAEEWQIRKLMAIAVNASKPMGMGYLHYQDREYDADAFRNEESTTLDYVDGRCVKLWINKLDDNQYRIVGEAPQEDYQTWAATYPTYEALLASAGIEVTT
jgi:hypothetical protein